MVSVNLNLASASRRSTGVVRQAAALLFFSCALILGLKAAAAASIPDTAAGKVFGAWLDAFDSGDQARLDAYFNKYQPEYDDLTNLRGRSGGFELLSIEKSEPLRIVFLLKERNSARQSLGRMQVSGADAPQVVRFNIDAIPPGAPVMGFDIDAATRTRVIEAAITQLDEFYVFPDKAKKMAAAVRARAKRGEYDSLTDGNAFAERLTENFRDISHDKHLSVSFTPIRLPEDSGKPSPDAMAHMREAVLKANCGFEKLERLDDNIGYLKFNFFASPDVCGGTTVAAMNFLSHVDALIFDLRDNGGGDPKMVALMATYLFDAPTHLNDLWVRKGGETQQFWTLPYVPGKHLASVPVFVLTSHRTFSGGEEFSNDLKVLKRATIVGEVTGGGAHPVSPHRIDDRFTIGVPFARAINPTTQTNWEGAGVEPDVKVPAAEALTMAQGLAAKELESRRILKP